MTALQWLTKLSAWWWPLFADHLWQTTLFVLVVFAGCIALRQAPARLRHLFLLSATLKFLVPVLAFVVLAQQAGIEFPSLRSHNDFQTQVLVQELSTPLSTLVANDQLNATVVNRPPTDKIYLSLTTIWLVGIAVLMFVWTLRRWRFSRALNQSERAHGGPEWQALKRAQQTLGMKTDVALVLSPLTLEPGVWSVRRPTVVMPHSISAHLSEAELEAIMLHELVHIRRRDNLVSTFQLAVCALFWFHPLVWVVSRKLFDEREQACDESVVEIFRAPATYASSILKVVRFCFGWRVAGTTGATSGSNLSRRIQNIMSTDAKRNAARTSRLVTGALVITALVIFAAALYSSPRSGQAATVETAQTAGTTAGEAPESMQPQADYAKTKRGKSKQAPAAPAPPAEPVIGTPPAPAAPPPPAEPEHGVVHPAPTAPAQPASPAAPSTPAAPVAPSADKRKNAKQKGLSKGELIEAP
ncbi:MAG TPA: M56 family metallopeptidase, partial [Pyrinomonadaceae bacterium]|nr:M56 family metallopeptidase [Pyrinomonadaceae bacterium]